MSLDIENALRVFLASAPRAIHVIPTLEISHSEMTKTYYLWREPYTGTITTEDGEQDVECLNFEAKLAGSEGHLDQVFDIAVDTADVEDEFREQMDLIPIDTTEKIVVKYREYLSDDLTAIVSNSGALQVESLGVVRGAARITAVSPRLNMLRTGELYCTRDIPMMRAFR